MKKSLIIIASALLLAVAAASDRLRYDSRVFADSDPVGGRPAATRTEYPPCIKGVREDRCIQLYERGVRRSYQRWLAAHDRGDGQYAGGSRPTRFYPVCRNRRDDNCRQVGRYRTNNVLNARLQRPQPRVAVRHMAPRPAAARAEAPAPARMVRDVRRVPVSPRPASVTRPAAPARRPAGGVSTPGI